MKRLITLFLAMLLVGMAQAQLSGKIAEVLRTDIFFEQLKIIHENVMGGDGKVVPAFLEKTMLNPKAISLTDFRREKERYYALCQEYNGIIDDIALEIGSFTRIKDLREIPLISYRGRIEAVSPKFQAFFKDLSRYHQDASIVGFLIDIYKVGKPIIQHLIQERVETIKRILVENLRALKLTPIPWEPAEAVVAGGTATTSREEARAKVGLVANDHYRSLNLAPGATKATIDAAVDALRKDYDGEIAGTSNPEIKDFFGQLKARVEAAKVYFDANPPKAFPAIVEGPKGGMEDHAATTGCPELKGKIEGLLQASKYMTKEQLEAELRVLVGK